MSTIGVSLKSVSD